MALLGGRVMPMLHQMTRAGTADSPAAHYTAADRHCAVILTTWTACDGVSARGERSGKSARDPRGACGLQEWVSRWAGGASGCMTCVDRPGILD